MVLVDGSKGKSHDGSNLCLEIAPKARFKQIKSTHSLLIALSPNEYRIFKTIASVNFLTIESANLKNVSWNCYKCFAIEISFKIENLTCLHILSALFMYLFVIWYQLKANKF